MNNLTPHMAWCLHGDRAREAENRRNARQSILNQVESYSNAGQPDGGRQDWNLEVYHKYREMHSAPNHTDAIGASDAATQFEHLRVAFEIQTNQR